MKINKSCRFCSHFQCEEIGDSDYGAIYSDTETCLKYYDLDDYGEEIINFNRDIERECFSFDIWKVLECDDELYERFIENDGDLDKIYSFFKEKYEI